MKQSKDKPFTSPEFLEALIATAYLPAEIPPIVTSKYFSQFCRRDAPALIAQLPRLIRLSTEYETFTAPRTANTRRTLALVHPLAQLGVSLLITEHRAVIRRTISKSTHSLYRTEQDRVRNRAFRGLDFRERDIAAARICSACPIVLRADISRFFYTAYTHSIPWAVVGKVKAKDWLLNSPKKLKSHWSNSIDSALQSCQSRETFGIPVGPDTSRVIAEILLAGVEANKAFQASVAGRPPVRLLDDLIIGFDDEGSANRTLTALRQALWNYNLQLNEDKTEIIPSRQVFREKWKLAFETFVLSEGTPDEQERDIDRLIDLTLHSCLETKTAAPAEWACRRLSEIRRLDWNTRVVLDALFRLARDFPSCISHVVVFLINNRQFFATSDEKNRIATWVKITIRQHIERSHDFEISWTLLLAGVFRVEIEADEFGPGGTFNAVAFAILGLLRERGISNINLSSWGWRKQIKKTGIYGENWLPFYEAVRRSWTEDKTIVAAVRSDPTLNQMLAARVTFLEDQIFDVGQINISRRVFKTARAFSGTTPKPKRTTVNFAAQSGSVAIRLHGYE